MNNRLDTLKQEVIAAAMLLSRREAAYALVMLHAAGGWPTEAMRTASAILAERAGDPIGDPAHQAVATLATPAGPGLDAAALQQAYADAIAVIQGCGQVDAVYAARACHVRVGRALSAFAASV